MLVIHRLVWDAWNVAHIARHGVTPDEVEELCCGDYIVRESYGSRLVLIGPLAMGRVLAAVLDPEPDGGAYYAVTARPASRRERALYRRQRGDEVP